MHGWELSKFGSKTMKVKNYYDKKIVQNEPNTWTFSVIWQRKIWLNFGISCMHLPLHPTMVREALSIKYLCTYHACQWCNTLWLYFLFIKPWTYLPSSRWYRSHNESSTELVVLYMIQSSANSQIVDEIFSSMLLIYNRNMKGTSTVPCGTPDFTGSLLDTWFFKVTCWLLLVSHCSIHLTRSPVFHSTSWISSNRLCGTLSEA